MENFEKNLVDLLGGKTIGLSELKEVMEPLHKNWYSVIRKNYSHLAVKKGVYEIPTTIEMLTSTKQKSVKVQKPKASSNLSPEVMSTDVIEQAGFGVIPDKDPLFVPFGFHASLKKILNSDIFYPIFITGLSGNGKTKGVEQACAETNRKVFRVNITVEVDEDDLIGGMRLVNGDTVFVHGPVINAMKEGAVLLLDEIDLGSNKIMCLQSILEGAPYYIKKTGETIRPAKGFTIVATANTKGRGSEDGRFVGTNILNEAFLERFVITVEQEYPSEKVEKSILSKLFKKYDIVDEDFADKLVKWAKLIREGFMNGSIDEIITTRRLVHIAKTYSIFQNKLESIKYCLARFDEETKAVFLDSYTKIDAKAEETPVTPLSPTPSVDHPF